MSLTSSTLGSGGSPEALSTASSPAKLRLPRPLQLFLLVGIALPFLCVATEAVCRYILHLPNPYNFPLTPMNELGVDLNGFSPKFSMFHDVRFFTVEPQYPFAYPAPMAVLYKLIYIWPWRRTYSFLLLLALSFGCGALYTARAAIRRGLRTNSAFLFSSVVVLTSYPFISEAKQGNLELWVWLIVTAGICLFLRGRGYSAAACFAIAGSMKIFPLIFLGLHISQRRWRPVFFGLAVAVTVSVISLWLLAPDILFTWHTIQHNIGLFQEKIILNVLPREIGFDHSLFSVVKRLWLASGTRIPLRTALRIYMAVVATAGIALFFTRIRHMPIANQVLALAVCSILLPPVSYDYTLIHLYAPLSMLVLIAVDAARSRIHLPGLRTAFVLLAVSLAPLSELIFHGVRFGGQVRALCLLMLLVTGLLRPFAAHADAVQPGPPALA